MASSGTLWRRVAGLVLMLGLLAGCGEEGDYLKISGGGFLFNYRIAEATCEVVAEPLRAMPEGATLEAHFQNPAGGEDLVVKQKVFAAQRRLAVTSPPLKGIAAGKEYKVALALIDGDGKTLEMHEKSFKATIDQSVLPDKPLTVGPGYAKNPENKQ